MGIAIMEDDSGTKKMMTQAIGEAGKDVNKEFMTAMQEYWQAVFEATQRLCQEYVYSGPESPHYKRTGTLYDTIRLVWETEGGGAYEVTATSQGAELSAMIVVGGLLVNPTTGRICDYAQAVHDGTRYMAERPFLTDAIAECEPLLQQLLSDHMDEALSGFERAY